MTGKINSIFNFSDRIQMSALNHRLRRSHVLNANIANSETPGYRALGYDFEDQLKDLVGTGEPLAVKATNPKHRLNHFTSTDGKVSPDVYVRPTESVPHDGNTVDLDLEMTQMAHNQ
ncbi:MAG: flagellar basal body rod protein FlgB, partial [Zetaproteobacteria bacterium]|nr:flagellar basal body rod protein FlgB [Zetaproteobacteria bacterium]